VNYAIVNAAMNDLIRPALYGARHAVTRIENAELRIEKSSAALNSSRDPGSLKASPQARSGQSSIPYSVVGPICESGDKLAEDVLLPELHRGDLLAIHHAGAYGMSMASHYNTRPRAAEVLVSEDSPLMAHSGHKAPSHSPPGRGRRAWRVIRPREDLDSLWISEVECLQ
jgi:diaminopimelate decarboxylase